VIRLKIRLSVVLVVPEMVVIYLLLSKLDGVIRYLFLFEEVSAWCSG